jgi:lipopolysaccharide biosynthesis regulator YciM
MEGLVFALLFLALAIGYGLGRLNRGAWRKARGPVVHAGFLEGLRQLIDEQHDAALDTLIGTLDVNETTIETHFALGTFWRRKGEVDRAIRIHQNMLEKPELSAQQLQQAQLELALDYTKSGLLDRAEVLLQELHASSVQDIRRQALQELVYLYQDEREWAKAIQHAESLCRDALPSEIEFWRHLQAHYCCELVEAHLTEMGGALVDRCPPALSPVSEWLAQARGFVPAHNRALLLQTRLELSQGDAAGAFNTIGYLRIEEPYHMIALPMVIQVHQRAGRLDDLDVLVGAIYHQHGTVALIPVLAYLIYERSGNLAAMEFAERELRGRDPTFLADLLGMLDKSVTSFAQLKPILDRALPFLFHCDACGFEGKEFYWCCPTCKHWL